MIFHISGTQFRKSRQGNNRKNYEKNYILKGWQALFLEVEKNNYCFYKKSRNGVLVNLCQNSPYGKCRANPSSPLATNEIL